ncbi:MAG: response regulator, partial [Planctomycetota bacterium]
MPENQEPIGRILLLAGPEKTASEEATLLSQGGFQVRAAATREEALAAVAAESFDLVLVDLDHAGEQNGLEVCRQIRANPN